MIGGNLFQRRMFRHTGVNHQHVNMTGFGLHFFHNSDELALLADIGAQWQGIVSDGGSGGLQLFIPTRRKPGGGTFVGETLANRQTDAFGSAQYDGHFIIESVHHCSPQ